MLLLAAVHGGDEDAGRVELVAAQLGHQAAAGAVPQPPADQLLDRRAVVDHLAGGVLDTAWPRSRTSRPVDDLVGDLGLLLGDLLRASTSIVAGLLGARGELLLPARPASSTSSSAWRVVGLGVLAAAAAASCRCRAGCRGATGRGCSAGRPACRAGSCPSRCRRGCCSAAGGRWPGSRPVCVGHAGHLLALVDAVAHQLLGQHVQAGLHGGDGRRGVQVQRQGDDHRLDAVVLGVRDQLAGSRRRP